MFGNALTIEESSGDQSDNFFIKYKLLLYIPIPLLTILEYFYRRFFRRAKFCEEWS